MSKTSPPRGIVIHPGQSEIIGRLWHVARYERHLDLDEAASWDGHYRVKSASDPDVDHIVTVDYHAGRTYAACSCAAGRSGALCTHAALCLVLGGHLAFETFIPHTSAVERSVAA